MTRASQLVRRPVVLIFVANLLAVAAAPTRLAAAIGVLGCLSALGLGTRRFSTWEWVAAAPLLVPLGARWASPQLIFLRTDHFIQLSFAWLILSAILSWTTGSALSKPNDLALRTERDARRATALFIAWSVVFWFLVVWDVGIGARVLVDRNAVPWNCGGDVLNWIFSAWDSHPVSEHLFLAWRSSADYLAKTAYENHSQAYLLWMYVSVKLFQAVTARPLFVAINLTPFMYMTVAAGAATLLLARDGSLRVVRPSTSLWLFLLYGVLITSWKFWHDLYWFTGDDPFPLVGAVVVVLLAALVPQPSRRLAVIAAGLLGALNPFVAPGLLIGVLCVYGKWADTVHELLSRNDLVWRVAASLTVTAILFFLLPRALIALHGYHGFGDSALFRSGLDGDKRYFTSIWQAIFAPCRVLCCGGGRSVAALLVPSFIPLAIAASLSVPDRTALAEQGRRLAFVVTPYLFSAILFPQAVSIHPYFYDHVLIMPVMIIGVAAMLSRGVQKRITGAVLLAVLLFVGALIMSNLIAIAQSFPRS